MTPALQFLVESATCPRCQGEGALHSVAGGDSQLNALKFHTHRTCDLCDGSGINPAAFEPMRRRE